MDCLTAQRLAESLLNDDDLDDVFWSDIEQHAEACQDCRRLLEQGSPIEQLLADTVDVSTGPVVEPPTNPFLKADDAATPERFGQYRVLKVLGRGGMGSVYLAEDDSTGRKVAIKVVHPHMNDEGQCDAQFLEEARQLSAVDHDNIVQILHVADRQGNTPPYIVMEYVAGGTLGELIGDANQPVHHEQVANQVRQLALGLAAIHAKKFVHRDIKPGNVLIDSVHQRLKLTDFGLAFVKRDESQQVSQAHVVGTVPYMSPEQLTTPERVDQRSDIFSLGSTFYEMLCNRPPFQGATTTEIQQRIVNRQPASPRSQDASIPASLENILMKCLRKRPEDRYTTAKELAEDLGRFLDNKPIQAKPVSAGERVRLWRKRNSMAATILAILAVVVVIAGGVIIRQYASANQQAQILLNDLEEDLLRIEQRIHENGPRNEYVQDIRVIAERYKRVDDYSWGLNEDTKRTQTAANLRLADLFRKQGKYEESKEWYQRSIKLLDAAQDAELSAMAYMQFGVLHHSLREFDEADEMFETATRHGSIAKSNYILAQVHYLKAMNHLLRQAIDGESLEAFELAKRELDASLEVIKDEKGLNVLRSKALVAIGTVHFARANYADPAQRSIHTRDAARSIRQAIQVITPTSLEESNYEAEEQLARSQQLLFQVLSETNATGIAALRAAVETQRKKHAEAPLDVDVGLNLAIACYELGKISKGPAQGRLLQESMNTLLGILRQSPNHVGSRFYAKKLGPHYVNDLRANNMAAQANEVETELRAIFQDEWKPAPPP